MSETRTVLIRLAAQHDINATRLGAFLDAIEHNLDEADATNVQEALRSVLAPGYTPVFVSGTEREPEETAPASPTIVFALVHVRTAEELAAGDDPPGTWDLNGIFEHLDAAALLCKSDSDAVVAFELGRDYTEDAVFDILRPTVSDETIQANLLSLFPKIEPKPTEEPPPGGGNGSLLGGQGGDSIPAGAGNDTILGGQGADSLTATEANETIVASGGNDSIPAGGGNDVISPEAKVAAANKVPGTVKAEPGPIVDKPAE